MALKTSQQYVESLRDGRVTLWAGENTADITTHPRFRVPIELTAADYDYDSPEHGELRRYRAEDGGEAHRIYQVPRSADDLVVRIEMMKHTSIGTLVSGVYMALMSVKDEVAQVNPRMRVYNMIRDLTADAYGGWQFVVALQAGGGLVAQRIMMNRTYNLKQAKERALRAAGAKIFERPKAQAAE